jgi:hypothetical protein
MNSSTISRAAIAAVLLSVIVVAPAEATVDHTYVSGTGTDTGGCISPASACRTFAYALTQTSAAGEIIVLNPADYSPVTITKSVSIVADGGGPAGIILATGNAITINARSTDVVNLRGLTLDGEGTAYSGIVLNSAGSLTITDCVVRHFTLVAGILLQPSGGMNFRISDTTSDNATNGLVLQQSSGAVEGVIDRFKATNDNGGIFIGSYGGATNVTILNSVMSHDGEGLDTFGQYTTVTVRNSAADYNSGYGFTAQGSATLILSDSIAIGNSVAGIYITPSSKVLSYGDNGINGNGTDVSGGTLTSVEKQ